MTDAYPLQWPAGWPRRNWSQRKDSSPFQVTFDKARKDLLEELRLLGAQQVVISSNLALRRDGMPMASAARSRIDEPGVAVYFVLRKRQMVMARDAYARVHDNLRSIGLAISNLRGLERHGGATMMERAFEGFAQIEAPGRKHWSAILGVPRTASQAEINEAFRRLAREQHPDQGGSDSLMADLNAARSAALRETRP